jgi:uncharacterized protein
MRIWLDQVQDEPFNWDETQTVPVESLGRPEILELAPVSWRGQVIFTDPGYFLRARLSYEQTLSCNRCLKPIVERVDSDVELMILVERQQESGGDHEIHEKDLGVLYLDEEILETDPILIEQLQLNVPMKPLCRPDCQGLCPGCGADRNAGPCSCEETPGDPRWASLGALKSKLAGEEK